MEFWSELQIECRESSACKWSLGHMHGWSHQEPCCDRSAKDTGKKQRTKRQHRGEGLRKTEGRVSFKKETMVNAGRGPRKSERYTEASAHCIGSARPYLAPPTAVLSAGEQVWSLRSNSMIWPWRMHPQEALENKDISLLLENDLGQGDFKMKKLKNVYQLLGKMQMREWS